MKKLKINHKYYISDQPKEEPFYYIIREDRDMYYIIDSFGLELLLLDENKTYEIYPDYEIEKDMIDPSSVEKKLRDYLRKNGVRV